ncbi:DUF1631 domain-containing protein [Agarilytica rhodophyticola]|uniref:DUF1631 domain-containing protein n=1 Tax=Agarilytica rhodophyticola TaxID=1737490 RepID=UPI000B34A09C|nr:DUF1631 domain-containing protein [Agarilytica rhodophyticola]
MAADIPTSHLELVRGNNEKKLSSPGVLKHIESEALSSSRQLMEHMFSATDDLFYELSKRATSNNEQNLYFESMREIRVKKEGLISAFLQALTLGFESLINPAINNDADKEPAADAEVNLSIVEGDDLEIELALKNMSSRARESYKNEIYELGIRLDHLLLQTNVDEDNNPLDPQQISKAFVKACIDKLKISIKTRLILFKLFEKHVLKQLGHVYADANQTLIETGILPKVPKNLIKNPGVSPAPNRQDSQEEQTATAVDTQAETQTQQAPPVIPGRTISLSPEALASLMTAIRGVNGGQNYYVYGSNPGPALTGQDLASILTPKQPVIDHKIARTEPKVVLRDLVNELLSKNNPNTPNSLKQSEEDTINLVAMFFEKILEDQDLPIVVQSLICRLQIPILKVALKDNSFLSNGEHPARKLINTITMAGLQFDESKPLERDSLYRTIVDGIQTINRQYSVDDSVFSIIQSELEELIKKESRKTHIVENRTTQTEMGKAKIRNAKAFAQSTLFDKLKDEKLPNTISEFLTNTWLQVLVITYIKEGKEGALWVENEQLISDLLWLCKSHSDERSKARAQRLKPEILSRIEKGLELAIDNADTRKSRIEEIEQTIECIVTGNSSEEVKFRNLDNAQKEVLGKAEGTQKSWDEMTALERQQSQYEELSSKFYLEAKNIAEGTWIEYQEENGKTVRCKLSKKIDSESYIFVNRFGFKSLEKSRRQFAYDMQFKKAKILDSTPIFDRILENIVSKFQET